MMKNRLSKIFVVLLFGVGFSGAALAGNIAFEMTTSPSGNSATYTTNSGTPESSMYNFAGGIGSQNSVAVSGDGYWNVASPFDHTIDATLEWGMKVINSSALGVAVYLQGGGSGWNFYMQNNQIRYLDAGGSFSTLALFNTTDAFHQYKILIPANSSSFDLLIDNNLVASANARSVGGSPLFQFGDPTISSGDGIADWDYVRLINSSSTNPAPEPATLALLFAGFGLLNLRRKQ
jgi:hypothetical protein